jgi:ubiquinone/menaquinone biosynthesis C-methylase UbiE
MRDEPASVDFDRAADFYDVTRDLGRDATAGTLDVLARELRGRGRVLEIGVGTGLVALPLTEQGFDIVGVDLSAAMLGRLIHKADGKAPMPLLRADATRLPFRAGAFGAAYGRHVLHLIPGWRRVAAELCRVVGRGVVLIDAGSNDGSRWRDLWDAMRAVLGPDADHVGLDMSREGHQQLDDAFTEAGAVPRHIDEIPYPDEDTVASMLEDIERRSPSWTWRVSDESLHDALEAARRWTLERYDTLDVRLEETAHVRWRAYDVGG